MGPSTPGPPAAGSRRWLSIVAGIAGLLVIALIAFVAVLVIEGGRNEKNASSSESGITHRESPSTLHTTSTTEPDTTTTNETVDLRSVTTQLDTMLDTSEASRTRLNEGVIQPFLNCTLSANDAVTQIGEVINDRKMLQVSVDRLEASTTDPTAQSLLSQLSQALAYSISSNQLYQAWFQANVGQGCSTSLGSGSRSQGDALGTQASSAKAAFVAEYNPVAARYGLRVRAADRI